RQPPVVPAMAGILPQAEQELLEGLLAGVEVVDERALDHLVDLTQVAVVGHPAAAAAAADQPEDHTTLGPVVRRRYEVRLVGADRTGHLPPGPHPLEAAAGEPVVLALIVGERPGVDLL